MEYKIDYAMVKKLLPEIAEAIESYGMNEETIFVLLNMLLNTFLLKVLNLTPENSGEIFEKLNNLYCEFYKKTTQKK